MSDFGSDSGEYVTRYMSSGERMSAVTAVAVNAASRLRPGVGESSISNNIGSGRAKVAARRLLSHASIPSKSSEYANVELEPISAGFDHGCTLPYPPCPFLGPQCIED